MFKIQQKLFILLLSINSIADARVSALGFIEPQGGLIQLSGVSASQGAVVSELYVSDGSPVKKGQLIAVLDKHQILQDDVKQVQAEVKVLKARLTQMKAGASKAKLNAQQAKINRLKTEFSAAETDCRKAGILYEKQAISQLEQQDKCLKKSSLQSELHEAQATLSSIAEVRSVDVAVTQAELEKAYAALAKTQDELERTTIRATVDGRVVKLHAKVGELIGAEGLLQLAQTGNMWVRTEIYETKIHLIKLGQQATVSSEILKDVLQGTVTQISAIIGKNRLNEVKKTSHSDDRVIEVMIKLDNPSSVKVANLINHQVTVIIETDNKPK